MSSSTSPLSSPATSPLSRSSTYYKPKERYHFKILGARDLKDWRPTPYHLTPRSPHSPPSPYLLPPSPAFPFPPLPSQPTNSGFPTPFPTFSKPHPFASITTKPPSPSSQDRITLLQTPPAERGTTNPHWRVGWSEGSVERGERVKFLVGYEGREGEVVVVGVHALRFGVEELEPVAARRDLDTKGEATFLIPLRKPHSDQLWITGHLLVSVITSTRLLAAQQASLPDDSADRIDPFFPSPEDGLRDGGGGRGEKRRARSMVERGEGKGRVGVEREEDVPPPRYEVVQLFRGERRARSQV